MLFGAARVLLAGAFDEQHVSATLAWAGQHPLGAFVVNLCESLGFSLIAFSCITLTGLVRGRGRWLTQIGGWGTAISWTVVAFNGVGVLFAALGDYPDRAAAADVLHHFMHSGQSALLLVPLVSSALWPLVFGLGLCRAGLVGWWYAVVVLADTVLEAAVSSTGVLGLVANIVPLAVVVGVWVRLLLQRARAVEDEPSEVGTAADHV